MSWVLVKGTAYVEGERRNRQFLFHPSEDHGVGIRVGWLFADGSHAVIPMKFARPQDAVAAARALQAQGITLENIIQTGHEQVYRIMCEALAW